jgi:PAS domain S-box-containing protein
LIALPDAENAGELDQKKRVPGDDNIYTRQLFDLSPIGLVLCKMDGELVDLNPAYARILGRSIEELLGLTYWQITPEKYTDQEIEQLKQLEARGEYGPYEKEYIHKNGELIPVRLSGKLVVQNGEQYILSSVEDISESKFLRDEVMRHRMNLEKLIEERKGKLSEREERLRSIFEAVADAVITIDAKGTIDSFNPAAENMFGYEKGEVIGHNISMLMPEPYHSEHDQYLKNYHETGEARVLGIGREVVARKKNGNVFPIDLSINEMTVNGQKMFTGIVRDVSKRKESEVALRKSEQRFINSQVYANIGTWDWDIQTGELYWSEMIAPLFGYERGKLETNYENFLNAVHPDDRQKVIDAVNNCVEKGAEYNIEHRCIWPNGTVRWLLEKGDVVRDEYGNPLHMLGVVQDVTDRKQAEDALKEAQKIASIGNWSWDVKSGNIFWSDEIFRIFGHEPGEFEPTYERFMDTVHPEDIDRIKASEHKAFSEGRHHSIDHRIILPNGNVHWVHEEAIAEKDEQGNWLRLSGTVQDITERKQAEDELLKAKEEAEKANQAKSEFLSSMSHELRTPLNAIIGFTQLLELDDRLDDDHKENLGEIHKAGNHLIELINEVLDLAKIESGHLNLSIESVELGRIHEECISLVRPLAESRGITIRYENAEALKDVYVQADRMRTRQILLNLLSNAIKYNRESGSVVLCTETCGEFIKVSVTDTGQGITEEQKDQLFNAFNRLGIENTEIEGTGIGLVIARSLVEHMGGTIDVESKVGEGSTFSFTLPVSCKSDEAVRTTAARVAEKLQVKSGDQYTVLYIEDNPANLRLVEQVFNNIGSTRLISAHEPYLGIALAETNQPDLVLLDINLPGMNGYEVLAKLKQRVAVKNIPVLAISANAMPSDIEKGLAAGFDDYITKPIRVPQFIQAVSRLLELSV